MKVLNLNERKRNEIIECLLLVPDERMGHTEGYP